MTGSICYCGNQCDGNDCFCDECNGVITERCNKPTLSADMLDYEDDTPFVVNE